MLTSRVLNLTRTKTKADKAGELNLSMAPYLIEGIDGRQHNQYIHVQPSDLSIPYSAKMNKWLSLCVIICVALVALTCSDGEDVLQQNPPANQPPTSGDNLTDEQRMAILQECRTFVNSLGDLTSETVQQVIVAWLKMRPEFEDAGIEAGNVWAYFHDGRMVSIIPAWLSKDDLGGRLANANDGGRLGITHDSGSSSAPIVTGGRGQEIPLIKKGILFNGLGTAFDDDSWHLQNMFSASNATYELTQQDATIDNLKLVNANNELAIVYILTHGGTGFTKYRVLGDRVFSLWTKDTPTPANEEKYKDDLGNGTLSYMLGLQNNGESVEWHYGITQEFVKKYMAFAENAFVYIDACSSMNDGSRAFSEQVLDKCGNKMGTYVGWTLPMSSITYVPTHRYIFDRMIASNDVSGTEQTPPQRPFDFVSVYNDMLTYPEVYNLGVSRAHGGRLAYNSRSNTEVMLTPSISYILLSDHESELAIHGIFGNQEGHVWINGKTAKITLWSKNLITCNIDDDGADSWGDVWVSFNGHNSNVVPLTSWTIPLTVTRDVEGFKTEAKLTLRLRGDVHRYRTVPNSTPITERPDSLGLGEERSRSGWLFGKASTGQYSVGGTRGTNCTLNGCQQGETHTCKAQAGDLPFNAISSSTERKYTAYYRWSRDLKKLRVSLFISIPDVGVDHVSYVDCPGGGSHRHTFSATENFDIVVPSEDHEIIEFEFDENFNIGKGDKSKSQSFKWTTCDSPASSTTRIEWPPVEAKGRPTAETAARGFNDTPTDP